MVRGVRFADGRIEPASFAHVFAHYSLPVIDYPGQEALAEGKRRNQRVMAGLLHGALLQPGETFSLWRYAGRPGVRLGYGHAAALKDGVLTSDIGGGTCLLATVVYNLGLLAGLQIVERKCHSLDLYGEARYFELGRDASIEYGYADVRFRNSHGCPVALAFEIEEGRVCGWVRAPERPTFEATIEVSPPAIRPPPLKQLVNRSFSGCESRLVEEGLAGVTTRTVRVLRFADGRVQRDDLGESVHHPRARVLEVGTEPGARPRIS
jgi:vancomycin resistance protein VanW